MLEGKISLNNPAALLAQTLPRAESRTSSLVPQKTHNTQGSNKVPIVVVLHNVSDTANIISNNGPLRPQQPQEEREEVLAKTLGEQQCHSAS